MTASSKNVIYTLGVYSPQFDADTKDGPKKSDCEFYNLTAPFIKTYASTIKADYYHVDNKIVRDFPDFTRAYRNCAEGIYRGEVDLRWPRGRVMHAYWYKIALLDHFLQSSYEKMFFLDVDILIKRYDYNVFEEAGNAEVFIATTEELGGLQNEALGQFYDDPWDFQRDRRPPNPRMAAFVRKEKYHFNSGAFVITKAGAQKVIDSCKPYSDLRFVPYIHNGDQAFLSCKFWEHCKVKKMPHPIHVRPFDSWRNETVFVHFCDDPRSLNKYQNIENYLYFSSARPKGPEVNKLGSDPALWKRYPAPHLDGSHGYPPLPIYSSPAKLKKFYESPHNHMPPWIK